MDWLRPMLNSLAEYPTWFVALCACLVAAGVIQLILKLVKWALILLVAAVIIVAGAAFLLHAFF